VEPRTLAQIAYTSRALYTPVERLDRPVALVEDGTIVKLASRDRAEVPSNVEICDFGDGTIAPGFVDLHIHGSAGYDVMQAGGNARCDFERFLARHGVTAYYPTTVAAPVGVIESALERLADAIEGAGGKNDGHKGGAQPLGIHLEGPFLSHARRGVHLPEDLIPPSLPMFERFWQAARGHIRLMTIAPEVEGALERPVLPIGSVDERHRDVESIPYAR